MKIKEALESKDDNVKITALIGFFTSAMTCHIMFPNKSIFEIASDYLLSEVEDKNMKDEKSYLQAAIDTYGTDNQTDVAIEEMAELTQALIHNRRGRPANIPEEIADVEIMLEQLKIIHACADEVKKQKDAKLKRLSFKLKEGKEESL